jgi:DNA-binding transcriptional regulator YhcF (GntR family)
MAWSFSSNQPVYLQIAERIRRSVLSGEYPPGTQLPSVRQLALEAAVNPNTVQHAFSDLEQEGILLSKGTLGRFVTDDTQIIDHCRKTMAMQCAKGYLQDMAQLGIPAEEAIAMIEEVEHEHSGM